MAVTPRDMPITREQVYGWLQGYEGEIASTPAMRNFLQLKVDGLNLDDQWVMTTNHDDLGPETHVVDMILDDITSYA